MPCLHARALKLQIESLEPDLSHLLHSLPRIERRIRFQKKTTKKGRTNTQASEKKKNGKVEAFTSKKILKMVLVSWGQVAAIAAAAVNVGQTQAGSLRATRHLVEADAVGNEIMTFDGGYNVAADGTVFVRGSAHFGSLAAASPDVFESIISRDYSGWDNFGSVRSEEHTSELQSLRT